MNPLIEIPILCDYTETVHPADLRDIQDNLKTKKEIEKLVLSIKRHGWLFPIFVWRDNKSENFKIVNGVHRLKAYYLLENDGFYLKDGLPIVEIEAKNFDDAKAQLLRASSIYSKVTKEGFEALAKNLTADELDELYDELPVGDFKFLKDILNADADDIDDDPMSDKPSKQDEAAESMQDLAATVTYQTYIIPFTTRKSYESFWTRMETIRNHNYPDMDYKDVFIQLLLKHTAKKSKKVTKM